MTTSASIVKVERINLIERPILERIVILCMIQEEWQLFPDLALYAQHLFHSFSVAFGGLKDFTGERLSEYGRFFMNRVAHTSNFSELLLRLMERYRSRDKRVRLNETNSVLELIADIMYLCFKYHPWTEVNQREATKSERICHFYLVAPSQEQVVAVVGKK